MQLTNTPRSSHSSVLPKFVSIFACSTLACAFLLVSTSDLATGQGTREPKFPVGKKFPVKYKFGEPGKAPDLKRPSHESGQHMEIDSGYDPEGDRRRMAERQKQQQERQQVSGTGLWISKSQKQATPVGAGKESTRRPSAVADGHYESIDLRRKPIRPPSGSSKYKG